MSMQQASAEYKANAQKALGEKFSILTSDMDRVRTSGTLDHALTVGQSAPEFTLPDAFGQPEALIAALEALTPLAR